MVMRRAAVVRRLLRAGSCTVVRADEIDALVNAEMKRLGIPGLSLTLIRHGQPAKTAAYGFAISN